MTEMIRNAKTSIFIEKIVAQTGEASLHPPRANCGEAKAETVGQSLARNMVKM